MSGWGSVAHLEDTGSDPAPAVSAPKFEIVFVTSDEQSRSFCHALCEQPLLLRRPIRIAHNSNESVLHELIAHAKLVVIATCRESLNKDSASQEQERRVAKLVQTSGISVALLSQHDQEAVQDHLAWARGAKPLVITPLQHGLAEGFRDCFPIGTQFLERGEGLQFADHIARELCARL